MRARAEAVGSGCSLQAHLWRHRRQELLELLQGRLREDGIKTWP